VNLVDLAGDHRRHMRSAVRIQLDLCRHVHAADEQLTADRRRADPAAFDADFRYANNTGWLLVAVLGGFVMVIVVLWLAVTAHQQG
jgi:hypothetical protein